MVPWYLPMVGTVPGIHTRKKNTEVQFSCFPPFQKKQTRHPINNTLTDGSSHLTCRCCDFHTLFFNTLILIFVLLRDNLPFCPYPSFIDFLYLSICNIIMCLCILQSQLSLFNHFCQLRSYYLEVLPQP